MSFYTDKEYWTKDSVPVDEVKFCTKKRINGPVILKFDSGMEIDITGWPQTAIECLIESYEEIVNDV